MWVVLRYGCFIVVVPHCGSYAFTHESHCPFHINPEDNPVRWPRDPYSLPP